MSFMKLIAITHEFFPTRGGIAVYVEETASVMASKSETEVWAPRHDLLDSAKFPFRIHQLPLKGNHNRSSLFRLSKEIRRRRDELKNVTVWLPEPGPILTAMFMALLCGFPAKRLVLTLHGSEIQRFAASPILRRLFQRLLNRSQVVGVVSDFNKQELKKHFVVPTEKIRLVPGAVRSRFADEQGRERNPNADTDKVVLLTVARIHPRKGQLAVLEALSLLPEETQKKIEYWISGPTTKSDYGESLLELSARLSAKIRFLGEVPDDDLFTLYKSADVFVMTSMPHNHSVEGLGLSYLEAGAAGLPVIAHRIGGVAEAVIDGQTGRLVAPTDRAGLAKAIKELVLNPTLRGQYGAAGHRHAKSFSWEKNTQALFPELQSSPSLFAQRG